MRHLLLIFTFFTAFTQSAHSQEYKRQGLENITKESAMAPVNFLADDLLEGRETGTRGAELAASYIISWFESIGVEPLDDEYLQEVPLLKYKAGENQHFEIQIADEKSIAFTNNVDFFVHPLKNNESINAEIIYVDYGIDLNATFNDFDKKNTNNKIIIRKSGYPKHDTTSHVFQHFKSKSTKQIVAEKNKMAQNHGALAILEFSEEDYLASLYANSENTVSKMPSFYDTKLDLYNNNEYELPCINITNNTAQKILSLIEKKSINKRNNYPKAKISLTTNKQAISSPNVIGKIEGTNKDEFIVIGAHYDHLGMRNGQIWNGADDNASGVSAILNIAKAIQSTGQKPDKTLIFAAWTAEEKGLNGSRHFVEAFEKTSKIQTYLNFDMIGRNADWDHDGNQCMMLYTAAYPELEKNDSINNNAYDINLEITYSRVEKPYAGSDNASFAKKGIPIFWFHTWGHEDYHQPTDHADKINIEKMMKIIRLSYLDIWDLAYDKTDK